MAANRSRVMQRAARWASQPHDTEKTNVLKDGIQRWQAADAEELYEIPRWSCGYFSVSPEGHLLTHPHRDRQQAVDLKKLIDRLRLRGVKLPLLVRFNDILTDRLDQIHGAFRTAIADHAYDGSYRCVYPIKVNQQRQVVDQIVEHGRPDQFGMEAGSKPELLALIARVVDDRPIICNGFKDAAFIETALLAQKLGRNVVLVVERLSELSLVLRFAQELGVRPVIGMRVKLAARSSGRWQSSSGYGSKFGLTVG